jgi:hypothetical protein
VRIPRIPRLSLAVVAPVAIVAAAAAGIGGYGLAMSSTLPMVSTVYTPAPVDLDTVGAVRVEAVPAPSGVDCGDRLYVVVTGTFAGDTAWSAACVDPGTLAADRVDAVAIALADPTGR